MKEQASSSCQKDSTEGVDPSHQTLNGLEKMPSTKRHQHWCLFVFGVRKYVNECIEHKNTPKWCLFVFCVRAWMWKGAKHEKTPTWCLFMFGICQRCGDVEERLAF